MELAGDTAEYSAEGTEKEGQKELLASCLSIDLEVDRQSGRIFKMAAIRGEGAAHFIWSEQSGSVPWPELDAFGEGAQIVVGHHCRLHDLPFLKRIAPELELLQLPVIDTLWLSPLAFPAHPYHKLVKHYKDGGLLRERRNNPELDARLSLKLLADEWSAFARLARENPSLCCAFHGLCGRGEAGFEALFRSARGSELPCTGETREAIQQTLQHAACSTALDALLVEELAPWPLAYALAWISVAGASSVPPPWVKHHFPQAIEIIGRLRHRACGRPSCSWCDNHLSPRNVLRTYFNFDAYRPTPCCEDGTPMQEAIVAQVMSGQHVLGILPTGTGKSVCYQVPALARYENTGALTVVISPLVALMEDQVRGLQDRGIGNCVALNGLLSIPERRDALERVRLGDVAILLLSPEQLRNPSLRRSLEQREIGAWVLDEAHCLSKWGQDFRTDYRYIGTFIRDMAGDNAVIPNILCLTATAKPDVVQDICRYFEERLGISLLVYNGGATRVNLHYNVMEARSANKLGSILTLLERHFGNHEAGGAIVYRARRALTETCAADLVAAGWSAACFHAGMTPEEKKDVQSRFLAGELKVIVATNAFGMGIDKPDVRLVLHADIPGSLENYVQEAGRAGRDGEAAHCVLLYAGDDVEGQFELSARSRLEQAEIQTILRQLRRHAALTERSGGGREVVMTAGEILADAALEEFDADDRNRETKVRTAIAWLEEAELAQRKDNRFTVYPTSLQFSTITEAMERLTHIHKEEQRTVYRAMLQRLFNADITEGVTTDELAAAAGIRLERVPACLHELSRVGLLKDDAVFTARVHHGVVGASRDRLQSLIALEMGLLALLQEWAPDGDDGAHHVLQLRQICQQLRDNGHEVQPQIITRLLVAWSREASEGRGHASIRLRKVDPEHYRMAITVPWSQLGEQMRYRHLAAGRLLAHLVEALPTGQRGKELLAETTIGKLHGVIEGDAEIIGSRLDVGEVVERSMLWMHQQEVLRLGKGMIIYRPAMTIEVKAGSTGFTQKHYQALEQHYDEQRRQIHIMARYAQRGIAEPRAAESLMNAYFQLHRDDFLKEWFPGDKHLLDRQTTAASWERIVESLSPRQREIVCDERARRNVLVLAGPGSGKTRVLVHRIAYLLQMRREKGHKILALTYNRHAAVEIRKRLYDLVGAASRSVTVLTCHALALRLTGRYFGDKRGEDRDYDGWIQEAVHLLQGKGLEPEDADAQRERLLAGFRWILVDEYQDIGPSQYELIAAMVGKSLEDPGSKLSLFAVGDDDQNIYEFNGTSVEFIRRFQEDYKAKPEFLIENYRSSKYIIAASNALIEGARNRMKAAAPIAIDASREGEAPGAKWHDLDPVGQGRVKILTVQGGIAAQALCAVDALRNLESRYSPWDWKGCAIIARNWDFLGPVQCYCEKLGIPTHLARDETDYFLLLRETQALIKWLREQQYDLLPRERVDDWLCRMDGGSPWIALLKEALEAYGLECGEQALPPQHLIHWLAEWGRQVRRHPRGMTLTTAHGAKGLEFNHVVVLDSGWAAKKRHESRDALLRLYYVAMTRARETLTLMDIEGRNLFVPGLTASCFHRERANPLDECSPLDYLQYYDTTTLKHVYLNHAGNFAPDHLVHRAIRRLRPGAPLYLENIGFCPVLFDEYGVSVGRMSKSFKRRKDMVVADVKVHAIIRWTREDNQEEKYRAGLQCDAWEVVLPTITYRRSGARSPNREG